MLCMGRSKFSWDKTMEITTHCGSTSVLEYSCMTHGKLICNPSASPRKTNTCGKVEAGTSSCRQNASGRTLGISRKRRRQKYVTLFSIARACLVGIVLTSTCSQASGNMRTDSTPLIFTDGSDGDGFRYFMRGVQHDLSEERPMGRSIAASLTEEYENLAFQTFKVIERWGNDTDILLVGGKDHVYMLDGKLADRNAMITYRERLTWRTPTRKKNECVMVPGQTAELCENFIRFIELLDNGNLMVCGTNAYSPACRFYKREKFHEASFGQDSRYEIEEKCRGQCVVPHNPTTASVSLYTNTNNGYQIFAAVINDFMSNDPLIMRKDSPTLLSNSLWLNEPTFLKLMEYRNKVYIFFRETAKESESGSTEKVVYARVAQVCKNDLGGMNVLANQWTTFLKARLRCGYSERQHLQFDNLTSVSDVVTVPGTGDDEMDVFFATFTTPWEWADSSISGVCAYSMSEIAKVFESGRFFGEYEVELRPLLRQDMHSMQPPSSRGEDTVSRLARSYPISPNDVPSPRPGSCGMAYSSNALYFAKEHPLMYDVVMPLSLCPSHVFHDLRAVQIAVDDNAGDSGKISLYVGTEDGKVLKLRTVLDAKRELKTVFIERLSVEEEAKCVNQSCSIRSMHVFRPSGDGPRTKPSLFVSFTDYMVQFPLARCGTYRTKECCSVDPDCGWGPNDACVFRTSHNSASLAPICRDTDPLPRVCSALPGPREKCDCGEKRVDDCDDDETSRGDDFLTIDESILSALEEDDDMDISRILLDSVSNTLRQQFEDTMDTVRGGEQRAALKQQLKEAIASTVGLVLKNHRQEYCLPSPAVNHLTHVYPLLLREVELWHGTALEEMSETVFDPKCWSNQKRCPQRVSFSMPLLPMLWEPLTKLIQNFSGHCDYITESDGYAASFRPRPRTQCAPLPGLEPCKNSVEPHCRPMRCQFLEYAVDAKAFFRHVNDSRQFLTHGSEPLWKAVNVTMPRGDTIRGHLEVLVSKGKPFMIDYSPVAEKVKIMFHYKPVRYCALTDAMCVGMVRGCDPEVERTIDHWFKWTMSKMPHRMRRCTREIDKAARKSSKRRSGRARSGGRNVDSSSPRDIERRRPLSNVILDTQERCRRIVTKVRGVPSRPISRNIWSLMASRCQRAGGIYSVFQQKIEFYNLEDVLRFFKNECTFEKPSIERVTFRKKTAKRRRRNPIFVEPLVTQATPFVIERNEDNIAIRFFVREVTNPQ